MPKNKSIKPAASKPADSAVANLLVAANDTTAPETPVLDTNEISHEETVKKTEAEIAAEAAAAEDAARAKIEADRIAALGKEQLGILQAAEPEMRKTILELIITAVKEGDISEEVSSLVTHAEFKPWLTNALAAYKVKKDDRVAANLLFGKSIGKIVDAVTVFESAFPDAFPTKASAKGVQGALARLKEAAKPRETIKTKYKKDKREGKNPTTPVFEKPRVNLQDAEKIDIAAEMQAEAELGQELFTDYQSPKLSVANRKELILLMLSEINDGVVSTDTRALIRAPGFMKLFVQQVNEGKPFGERADSDIKSAPLAFYVAFQQLIDTKTAAGIAMKLQVKEVLRKAAKSLVTPPESAPTIPANTAPALNPDAPAVGG